MIGFTIQGVFCWTLMENPIQAHGWGIQYSIGSKMKGDKLVTVPSHFPILLKQYKLHNHNLPKFSKTEHNPSMAKTLNHHPNP